MGYLVDKALIDLLVSAAGQFSDRPGAPPGLGFLLDDDLYELTGHEDLAGAMLWRANFAAVGHPEPTDGAEVASYVFDPVPGVIEPVVVLRALAAYEFESFEQGDWYESDAKIFADSLRGLCISSLPGYDDAPDWFTDRDHFVQG